MCTKGTTTKVVVGLTAVSVTAQAVRFVLTYFYDGNAALNHTVGVYGVVLLVVVPVSVLIINIMVVREVRRAADHAATNLGLQQNRQSTTSNSAVPTIMLLSTSFVYVLLSAPHCVIGVVYLWRSQDAVACADSSSAVTYRSYVVAWALMQPVYAYNFFVYVITGHRFRFELRELFHCRRVAAAAVDDGGVQRRGTSVTRV